MGLKLSGPSHGSGMWDAVKYAVESGWPATSRLALLMIVRYGLCGGGIWIGIRAIASTRAWFI